MTRGGETADAGAFRYWAAPTFGRDWAAELGGAFQAVSRADAELVMVTRLDAAPCDQAMLVLTDERIDPQAIDGARDVAVLPTSAAPEVLRMMARLMVERRRWRQAAHTDALTGLPNRRAWERALREVVQGGDVAGPWVVAIFDLDQFKRLNETSGYAAGDKVLAAVAAHWSTALREDWTLARIGGDEFAALAPAADAGEIDNLRRLVATAAPGLTASAGYVLVQTAEDLPGALERADAALRRAKQAGGDRTAS